MNREQFYQVLAPLDDDRLRKALWNVYWRGTADVRQRIEAELAGDERACPARAEKAAVDAQAIGVEVDTFVSLARAGAYLGRDRRVTPRERTRWRFEFKRLATGAERALRAEDPGPAEAALERLIDLACETAGYDYFRSDDPMAAAGFAVSDAVSVLWTSTLERRGFAAFADSAAPQLIRWESRYGWTRRGEGPVAAKETTLAVVLSRMLRVADTWERFAEAYLQALDTAPAAGTRGLGRGKNERADALAQWHELLLGNLEDADGGVLDQIAGHPALAGPEQIFLSARLADRRGDTARARDLVSQCLQKLPGNSDFRRFAAEIGAPVP